MTDSFEDRFGGIGRLYGASGLARLRRARVCVVGIGGVGSWAVEALARSGLGALTLIDLDDVCVSNTNRQLHALDGTVGLPKVEVMAARARLIQPECEVTPIARFLTPSTVDELLAPPFDYVVDAIDDLHNKCLLLASCRARGLRVVTVGGAGGRRDPTAIQVDDLTRSGQDGLLRRTRKRLRQEHAFPDDGPWGIPCVFSREAAVFPSPDGEVCAAPARGESLRMDCASGFGAATFVTGAFGFAAAAVVVGALAAPAP
jgi:tRNA A37 threonylcarbamoyladenosine dehydratase